MSRLRREAEDLLTHRFQTPWYPDEDEPGIVEAGGYYLKRFPPKPSTRSRQLVGRPSPTRANYKNTSKNCSINRGNSNSNGHNSHNSDSSYTTYSRLDTPASSKSERRQRSFY
ncbi:hypothetical protein V1264_011552 [Littorina saxatilis]|uniref:Uncharacterized protein n=2 Tax=Littorina saxatilis TaxID=31220 RepID=A0AAN9GKL9_9CAEN